MSGVLVSKNPLVSGGLLCLVALGIYVAFRFYGLELALSTILVGATWAIDQSLKHAFGFDNTTAFADLSLVSFVFIASYSVSLLPTETERLVTAALTSSIMTAAVLFLLWLGNLIACRAIKRRSASTNGRIQAGVWGASVAIGVLSAMIALAPLAKQVPAA